MPTRVLIIGAAGKVGSAALVACLARRHLVTAFVRNPAKLPLEIRNNAGIRVVTGDATSHSDLVAAIRNQDAIIQAAVYGSNSPWGTSDSERVIETILAAIKTVQSCGTDEQPPMRLWVMSGQVLMDIPGRGGQIIGDVVPIHPEHYQNYTLLQQEASDVDWSLLCPGKVTHGEPTGSLVRTINEVGPWQKPFILGRLILVGTLLNVLYNLQHQRLTFKSIGTFLADNLGPGAEMRGKRVCILEV